jgi:hypothetical protein
MRPPKDLVRKSSTKRYLVRDVLTSNPILSFDRIGIKLWISFYVVTSDLSLNVLVLRFKEEVDDVLVAKDIEVQNQLIHIFCYLRIQTYIRESLFSRRLFPLSFC